MSVMTCGDVERGALRDLLAGYGLELCWVADGEGIPGSHWGTPEAGLIGSTVYVRGDTPVHSFLHETCHSICMGDERRRALHTDSGGDDDEECAVCYLQVLLADRLPGVGRERLMSDMDEWGYSFRLGSTCAWLEEDAEDAREWLLRRGLIDARGRPVLPSASLSLP